MFKHLFIAIRISIFTLFLTGTVYPLLVTGIAYVFFHKKATGSLISGDYKNIIGSELIGQNFKNPAYFFPRPSHAGNGYDGLNSGGSNLAPTSKKLLNNIHKRIETLKTINSEPIPLSLLTSSASGLDPHISLEAAYWQAPRIALNRDVSLKRIIGIIDTHIERPQFYLFGVPRLNVLKLNLTLDQFFGHPRDEP